MSSSTPSASVPSHIYPKEKKGYEWIKLIGRGSTADVFLATVLETKEQVALKVVSLNLLTTTLSWEKVKEKIALMKRLRHKNLVLIHTFFFDEESLVIVMPYFEQGSCVTFMRRFYPRGIKDEKVLFLILHQVLEGLDYLHENQIVHRDVKAANIFISNKGEVKVGDFGIAGSLLHAGKRQKRSTFAGSLCWMAPEVMCHTEETKYDEKVDIWSFAITAMELAFGKAPRAHMTPLKLFLTVCSEAPPTCKMMYIKDEKSDSNFSSGFSSLLDKCLKKTPSKRPTTHRLLEHRWFAKQKKLGGKHITLL